MKPRTWTEQEKAEIVKAYRNGSTARELSRRHGCRTTAISTILAEAGLAPQQGGHRRFTDVEEAQIAAEYGQGDSTATLAARYGISRVLVTRIARDHGQIIKGRGNRHKIYTEEQIAEIIRLRTEENWTQQAIGDKFRITQAHVSTILRQQGHAQRLKPLGVSMTGQGYIREAVANDDPMFVMAPRSGYVLQHRLVMARSLGRPLDPTETVHHIDGDRSNNEITNLQLRQGRHGNGVTGRCRDCGSVNIENTEL